MVCALGPYGSECLHSVKILMEITDNFGPEKNWSITVAKYKKSLFQQYADMCIFKEILFSISVFSSNFFCLRM